MVRFALVAVSVLAGLGLGWLSGPASRTAGGGFSSTTSSALDASSGTRSPKSRWVLEDFNQAAQEEQDHAMQLVNPLDAGMAGWTDQELRAALEESLKHPEFALPNGGGGWAVSALIKEWMKRDLKSVLAWFEGVKSPTAQEKLAGYLGLHWPLDRADEGLDFVIAHREWFADGSASSVVSKCVVQQAGKGPSAVAEMMRRLKAEKLEMALGDGLEMPAGFNFLALVKEPVFQQSWKEAGIARTLMRQWYEQDREQAFAWTMENQGVEEAAGLGYNKPSGQEQNQEWLGGKFTALSGPQQDEFIQASKQAWIHNPRFLIAFTKQIGDADALTCVGGIAAQSIFMGKAMDAMPVIESIPDVEQRLALLENITPDPVFKESGHPLMFDAASEAELRKKLAEWKAGDARTEAIVSRFKP